MKSNKSWKLVGGVGALFLLVMLAIPYATARANISVTVYPTFLEFTGDPGGSTTQEITISNDGTDSAQVSLAAGVIHSARPEDSAVAWLTTDVQHFTLAPGKLRKVVATIRIPSDAAPGGHFAALYIQASMEPAGGDLSQRGAGTGVGTTIASSFLITVRSRTPSDLKLDGVVARVVPVAIDKDKLGFRVEIQNNGNVHFVPTGEVSLMDKSGNTVGTLTLPETTPVLPGSKRSFYVTGGIQVPAGDYKATAKVGYGWDPQWSTMAKTDPGDWANKETTQAVTFNSVPKLVVSAITTEVLNDNTMRVAIEVQNQGDVEVSPQGYVDFLTSSNERAFALNLGTTDTWVGPQAAQVYSATYSGVIPKGTYQVHTDLAYHGAYDAQKTETIKVAQDVVPPSAPSLPEQRKAEMAVVRGMPMYVLIMAIVGGMVAAIALMVVVQRFGLLNRLTKKSG